MAHDDGSLHAELVEERAGVGCSAAAWTGKMTCLGYKPCYNWWATANNNNCL